MYPGILYPKSFSLTAWSPSPPVGFFLGFCPPAASEYSASMLNKVPGNRSIPTAATLHRDRMRQLITCHYHKKARLVVYRHCNGVFTPEQDDDKTNVEPVHFYYAFHTRIVGSCSGVKAPLLLWQQRCISLLDKMCSLDNESCSRLTAVYSISVDLHSVSYQKEEEIARRAVGSASLHLIITGHLSARQFPIISSSPVPTYR